MAGRRGISRNQVAQLLSLVDALRRMGVPLWVMVPLGLVVLLAVLFFRPAIEERLGVRLGLPEEPAVATPVEEGAEDTAPPVARRAAAGDRGESRPPVVEGDEGPLQEFFVEVKPGVFESPAGLRYRRGSRQGHRLRHVMAHARDQPSRDGPHGVFDADEPLEVFQLVDEAYRYARSGRDTSTRQEEGRTKHTVNLWRRIGYVGGRSGNADGRPEARRLRIILDGVNVITAYPVR